MRWIYHRRIGSSPSTLPTYRFQLAGIDAMAVWYLRKSGLRSPVLLLHVIMYWIVELIGVKETEHGIAVCVPWNSAPVVWISVKHAKIRPAVVRATAYMGVQWHTKGTLYDVPENARRNAYPTLRTAHSSSDHWPTKELRFYFCAVVIQNMRWQCNVCLQSACFAIGMMRTIAATTTASIPFVATLPVSSSNMIHDVRRAKRQSKNFDMQGHYDASLFRWFVNRVAFYAYGPQLKARLRSVIKICTVGNDAHGKFTACPRCKAMLFYVNECGECGFYNRYPHMKYDVSTTAGVEFFQRLGSTLLALDIPQTHRKLSFFAYHAVSGNVKMCHSCFTFKSPPTICVVECSDKQCGRTIHCRLDWCNANQLRRCPMCAAVFCKGCVDLCGTCGNLASCRKCGKTYQCQESHSINYYNPICVTQCVWHAPRRTPFVITLWNGDGITLVCDSHLQREMEWLRIRATCKLCNLINCGYCENKKDGCNNPVCSHTSDWIDNGDHRCTPCKGQTKKQRLE